MKTVARRMERERWFGKDEDKTKNRERKTKGSKRAAFPVSIPSLSEPWDLLPGPPESSQLWAGPTTLTASSLDSPFVCILSWNPEDSPLRFLSPLGLGEGHLPSCLFSATSKPFSQSPLWNPPHLNLLPTEQTSSSVIFWPSGHPLPLFLKHFRSWVMVALADTAAGLSHFNFHTLDTSKTWVLSSMASFPPVIVFTFLTSSLVCFPWLTLFLPLWLLGWFLGMPGTLPPPYLCSVVPSA